VAEQNQYAPRGIIQLIDITGDKWFRLALPHKIRVLMAWFQAVKTPI
jgi:hypothetical protein